MRKIIVSLFTDKSIWIIFLSVNMLFIWKYVSRTTVPVWPCIILWCIFVLLFCKLFRLITNKWPTSIFFIGVTVMLTAFAGILLLLIKIDPLSVNVDRWSATTYFLDGLSQGIYPYGIHTHVCETNYPSPLPLWHYIHFVFWLLGDVGLGLFAFLFLFATSILWFTRNLQQTTFAVALLILSPAYWWEVLVRSDGLSNAILVFCVILLMERKKISFTSRWLTTSTICALTALTRLSAIIPVANYIVKDYIKLSLWKKISSIMIILAIIFLFFAPYIFWDTTTWVFFSRNPFMSQTSTGSPLILVLMIVVDFFIIYLYNTNLKHFMRSTTWFVFAFFLISIMYNHFMYSTDISIFEDSDFDISYLTLSFPYCLYTICTDNKKYNNIK